MLDFRKETIRYAREGGSAGDRQDGRYKNKKTGAVYEPPVPVFCEVLFWRNPHGFEKGFRIDILLDYLIAPFYLIIPHNAHLAYDGFNL